MNVENCEHTVNIGCIYIQLDLSSIEHKSGCASRLHVSFDVIYKKKPLNEKHMNFADALGFQHCFDFHQKARLFCMSLLIAIYKKRLMNEGPINCANAFGFEQCLVITQEVFLFCTCFLIVVYEERPINKRPINLVYAFGFQQYRGIA